VAQLVKTIETTLASLKGKFVVDTLLFDIFGFSRGAAAARHFANRIQAEDSTVISAISTGMGTVSYCGAPAGITRFLGIMDTVAAVGTVANGLDPHSADTGSVNIQLRPGVAQKVFHLTAQHECRYNFALNSIARDWPELALPGMHPILAVVICRNCGKTSFLRAAGGNPAAKSAQCTVACVPTGNRAVARAGTLTRHPAHYTDQ
jgi:hypothetical protein